MKLVEEISNGLFKNAHNFTFEQIFWDVRKEEKEEGVGILNALENVEPIRYGRSITINELTEVMNMVFRTRSETTNDTQEIQSTQTHYSVPTYATEEELINYFDRISQDEEQQTNTEH